MARDLAETLQFVAVGTKLCAGAIGSLDEAAFDEPAKLPGWTRRHLVAHLAANAEAVGRLLRWARTGEVTPMYASAQQRAADIEAGARLGGPELVAWFERSAQALDDALASMTEAAWAAEVVTAQGRTVPAGEVPWMRSREVLVHAVDLGTGLGFADLPTAFLEELRAEILAKRAGENLPELSGDLPAVVAYLAGRPGPAVRTADGGPAPQLTPWL